MKLARRSILAGLAAAEETPRRGGVLRSYHPDSPASMSLLEEATIPVVAAVYPARSPCSA
jgi:hypothetical protein